jgi:hypothetical protein
MFGYFNCFQRLLEQSRMYLFLCPDNFIGRCEAFGFFAWQGTTSYAAEGSSFSADIL